MSRTTAPAVGRSGTAAVITAGCSARIAGAAYIYIYNIALGYFYCPNRIASFTAISRTASVASLRAPNLQRQLIYVLRNNKGLLASRITKILTK